MLAKACLQRTVHILYILKCHKFAFLYQMNLKMIAGVVEKRACAPNTLFPSLAGVAYTLW